MRMLEYEGKALFRECGIPTPEEHLAKSGEEACLAAEQIGLPVVIKAQVLAGGRGKAGGIKVARNLDEVRQHASSILGMTIKNEICHEVLVAPAVTIERELYAGITIDPRAGGAVLMFSAAGGMDIEEVARTNPERILRMPICLSEPPALWDYMNLLRKEQMESSLLLEVAKVLKRLADVFIRYCAQTVEINPLALTEKGIMALDSKVVLDNDALKRLNIPKTDGAPVTDLEKRAAAIGVRYVQLDGEIAVLSGGAGLGMATMDLVHFCGSKPSCFIDCGGGITSEATAEAVRICLDTPGTRGVMVNAFGGGNDCGVIARGILAALNEYPDAHIMVKMRGFSQEIAWDLLKEAKVPFVSRESSKTAVQRLINSIHGE